MRKVDILNFRREVLALLDENREKLISLERNNDDSLIIFKGNQYTCEITLNDKWIGYELEINIPKGFVDCGLREDTDLYPIYGDKDEMIALQIYDELLSNIKKLFSGHIYYMTNSKVSYVARRIDDDKYLVNYWESKKFLFWSYSTGRRDVEYNKADLEKLKLEVLT